MMAFNNTIMNNQRKKILFINGHLNVGGIEKSLVDLLNWIDYSRYDIDLLLLEGKGDYLESLPKAVNIIYRDISCAYGPLGKTIANNLLGGNYADIIFRMILLLSKALSLKALRWLHPLLHVANHYDVAIAYRPGICTDLLVYAINSDKKISWWHHGECSYNQQMISHSNLVWNNLDYMATVSEGCKRMLARTFDLPINKLIVIPNMIDVDKITQLAGNTSPYCSGRFQIITVGRLSKEKQVINAVYAAKKLREAGISDFCWNIVGDGDELDRMKCETKRLDLQNHIYFWGKKSNPYPYIKYANILVHTSYVESQCITVLEAMALRTPCVVCKSLGTQEYMQDGTNGILVEHGVDSLYRGILSMLSILGNKDALTESAYNTVRNRYTPPKILNKLNSLLWAPNLSH